MNTLLSLLTKKQLLFCISKLYYINLTCAASSYETNSILFLSHMMF